MIIHEPEEIRKVFSLLHDGWIERHEFAGSNLRLTLEISYLAGRIDPNFTKMRITVHEVRELRFHPWHRDGREHDNDLADVETILQSGLEVLSGDLRDDEIVVACAIGNHDSQFCGGELVFRASGLSVTDQAGKELSIDQLANISREYWDDFKEE